MLGEPPSRRMETFSLEDAYHVSRTMLAERERSGWVRVGRKIGFTNPSMYAKYGVYEPMFGYMYDRTVAHSAAGGVATVPLSGFVQPLIEPELVFKLARTPLLRDDTSS